MQPGHDAGDRQVPHSVVRSAIGAGDTGAVEDEGDARPVECAVHEDLVEGPVEEGRIDRDDRVQAGEGQAGGHRRGMLLGDADVEDAIGVGIGKTLQPHRNHHRSRDRDNVLALAAEFDHFTP